MTDWFQRLPGFTRTPAGIERTILRVLPKAAGYGTLLMMLPSMLTRLATVVHPGAVGERAITTIDIYVAGLVFLHWNVLLTVGIGAFIVMVMKGPAYVADGYALSDADAPRARRARDETASDGSSDSGVGRSDTP